MDNLKNNILNKIKDGEIKQTSSWYFLTRDYFFYTLTALSIVFGSIAVSSILFQSITEHMRPLRAVSSERELWVNFLQTAPYIWLIILSILVLVAWINYKHTKRAYKRHNILIVSLVLLLSCIGGGILFSSGRAATLEQHMRKNIPLYNSEIERRQSVRDKFIERKRGSRVPEQQGLRYVAPAHRCPTIRFACNADEMPFHNEFGCGCQTI